MKEKQPPIQELDVVALAHHARSHLHRGVSRPDRGAASVYGGIDQRICSIKDLTTKNTEETRSRSSGQVPPGAPKLPPFWAAT
jgi:hypothetical protein